MKSSLRTAADPVASAPDRAGPAAGVLARWACDPAQSRGRRFAEPSAHNEHQRDRDRIVHSSAFRRLVYKTQVFINHEGDLFRTRLTHSLEVSQTGRRMARALHLGEDLVEAIALAHDLGHTPFGHAGQDALRHCMAAHGGFEHNLQSLRVVDLLESRYPGFDGLNLSFETREGILKHCSREHAEQIERREPGGVARRFIDGTRPGLEAQLVDLADEIAYGAHDIDDGVRSGLVEWDQLQQVPLVARVIAEALDAHPALAGRSDRRLLAEAMERLRTMQMDDVVCATAAALASAAPADAAAVRAAAPLVGFSPSMRQQASALKRFLFSALYRHPQVMAQTALARQVVYELFAIYLDRPAEMAPAFGVADDRPRAVADYIAGMTDRFALREHRRLTGRALFETAAER